MTKNILAAVFFSFITYAIVSDFGKPQHDYRAHGIVTLAD
jgi:hypothetical protein